MPHRSQQVQGLEPVFRGNRMKALGREESGQHFTRVAIVFDDEDVADRQGHHPVSYQAACRLGRKEFGKSGASASLRVIFLSK